MKKKYFLKIVASILCITLSLSLLGCGNEAKNNDKKRDKQDIIEEMVVDYGNYGDSANKKVKSLLKELKDADAKSSKRWESIIKLWSGVNNDLKLNYDILPSGLPKSDELCIVVLGFQLKADGTMKKELIERLKVVKNSAKAYPKAMIVCTGGGTAKDNKKATEAGKMAEWLRNHGVDKDRIIVEDKSITTAQNAIYTFDILEKKYPQVNKIAIVSSDYHIATGKLLFEAESILRAKDIKKRKVKVVSNAAWKAPSGKLSTMFQAGALIELSGDVDTAFDIYYDNYDIHKLPDIHEKKK